MGIEIIAALGVVIVAALGAFGASVAVGMLVGRLGLVETDERPPPAPGISEPPVLG